MMLRINHDTKMSYSNHNPRNTHEDHFDEFQDKKFHRKIYSITRDYRDGLSHGCDNYHDPKNPRRHDYYERNPDGTIYQKSESDKHHLLEEVKTS